MHNAEFAATVNAWGVVHYDEGDHSSPNLAPSVALVRTKQGTPAQQNDAATKALAYVTPHTTPTRILMSTLSGGSF